MRGYSYVLFLAAALAIVGCSGNAPTKGGKPAATPAEEGPITYEWAEQVLKERMAWRRKATKLLVGIKDEKSADAAIPQLKELIREDDSINQRASRSKTKYPPEIENPLQQKYGKDNEDSRKAYIEAQLAFERRTEKEALTKYVERKYDLSITRMKIIKREE